VLVGYRTNQDINVRTEPGGDLRRGVGAAVRDDPDLELARLGSGRQAAEQASEDAGFIVCGNDHRHHDREYSTGEGWRAVRDLMVLSGSGTACDDDRGTESPKRPRILVMVSAGWFPPYLEEVAEQAKAGERPKVWLYDLPYDLTVLDQGS